MLQCIQDSGLLPQELAAERAYIISADAAAKYVVHHMKGTPQSAPGHAVTHKVTIESEPVTMGQMADWVETLKGGHVDRYVFFGGGFWVCVWPCALID
jgi:hypothetical protein